MSQDNGNGVTSALENPVIRPFIELWSAYAKEATENTEYLIRGMHGANPADAFQEFQARWMDSLGRSIDAFLRSPIFLQWMRHNADFITKSKEQTNNISQEIARNYSIPTSEDISGLFERLHSVEDTILVRLNELHHRLDGIESHIGVDKPAPAKRSTTKRAPAKRTSTKRSTSTKRPPAKAKRTTSTK